MLERINKIFGYSIKAKDLVNTLGVSYPCAIHILNGRNKPSFDTIQRIHEKFPAISLNWLLYGDGSMYIHHDEDKTDYVQLADITNSFKAAEPAVKEVTQETIDKLNEVYLRLYDITNCNRELLNNLNEIAKENANLSKYMMSVQDTILNLKK